MREFRPRAWYRENTSLPNRVKPWSLTLMWHRSERTSGRGTAPDRPPLTGTDVQAACEAAFGASPLATAVTEGERHVLRYLNAAWLEFAGADDDPGLGRPFGERFPELAVVEPTLLNRVYRTGTAARLAKPRYLRHQGEVRFTMAAWPWGATTSAPSLTVVQLQVIESRRQTLERGEMPEIARELREVNEQLLLAGAREREVSTHRARLLAGAEAASRAKSAFIGDMSHELRTPLNSLIGYADLIAGGVAGPVTQKQTEMLGRLKASALHLLALITQILDFSRTEAGRIEVRHESIDAGALAREAATLVEPLVHQKGVAFTLHVPDDPIELETDPGLFKQILINLLNNAMKFTDAGEIRLVLEVDGKDLLCTVQDTGIGIPPDQLQRIFEPFHQADADGKRPTEGTGLGLTVSRRLARLLGGDLTVQSRPGEGSTFTVRCPLRPPHRPQSRGPIDDEASG